MDIAKYIGLYLLKNQYCYVHGIGNMELKKIRSAHDGSALTPPSYEVHVTPGGSIDDNLANFIATNEQVSISKAANTLREFSIQVRKDIAEGKEVVIPNIGKFIEEGGKVKFITDQHFKYTPASLPTIKNSKQLDEQNSKLAHKPSYPPPAKADSVNWNMVIIAVVLLLILGGAGYFIYDYTKGTAEENTPPPVIDTPVQQPVIAQPDTLVAAVDTVDSGAVSVPIDSTTSGNFTFVIGNYPSRLRAEKRVNNLMLNGNKVEMVPHDSASFFVVTTINCKVIDTVHVKDSLRRMFGYTDVKIIK